MFQSAVYQKGDYIITTDPGKLDRDALYRLLSSSYWANARPREVIDATLAHSLCFSAYHQDELIGFARVVTDTAVFAYLCDVIIDEAHRGHGLGKWLMESVLSHPDTRYVRHWCLRTQDAHGLYRQYGFSALDDPDRHMRRINPEAFNQFVAAKLSRKA